MDINIGDKVHGEIVDFTHEGNGILKVDGIAIFVPNTVIGDIASVRIEELKKNYAIGSVIKIIELSADRVNSDVKNNGEIPLINYDYDKQLEWKKNKVQMDLVKFAGLDGIKVNDTLGMNHPYRYRNHIQIPVGKIDNKVVLGFFEKGSHNIVDMKGSILQPEVADRVLELLRKWIIDYNIEPYDRRSKKGVLRHIGLRINKNDEVMIILVTATDQLIHTSELIDLINSEAKEVVSIYHNVNKLVSSSTYGRKYNKIYGRDRLIDSIGELKFIISPNSFFQINRTQAEVIYGKALEYLDLNKEDEVFDIYSGIGTLSLFIANKAKKVYGLESVDAAIKDARKNAKLNNIDNAEFIAGKAEMVFPDLLNKGIKGNKVVIDPPRKGCEKEVLEAIVVLQPERVVYVSCNSATMARDVKYLIDNGYKVMEVQPVDIFSHTAHVETCVLLSHKKSQASSPSL